ncbi:MAG: alginate export family protein [Myxococcota bacterium]|nr:alginate export family protein [Myxococcota bacterium]
MARVFVGAMLAFVAWSSTARAQVAAPAPESLAFEDWQLVPLFEARARGEYRRDVDGRDRGMLVERARLGLDVQRGWAGGRVSLQDARVWNVAAGSNAVPGPGAMALTGAFEAWGEAHSESVHPSFVRIGRQPVAWGEGRLLGTADWAPRGRSLDGLRARVVAGETAFEALAASLASSESALDEAYGELFGGRAEWARDPLFAAEAYVLVRLAQTNPSASLESSVRGQTYTGALRLHGDAAGWAWGVEGAYQLGRAADLHRDRAAWAVAAHIARVFDRIVLVPTVQLGFSHASGDSGGSTYRAFDPLLPDVHTWHGAMDLFAWSNEQEANARITVAAWADASASVAYRYARLADTRGSWRSGYLATIARPSSNTRSELGHEIDAAMTWSPWTSIELVAGYSILVLGAGARALLETGSATNATSLPPSLSHFGYAQAVLRVP